MPLDFTGDTIGFYIICPDQGFNETLYAPREDLRLPARWSRKSSPDALDAIIFLHPDSRVPKPRGGNRGE